MPSLVFPRITVALSGVFKSLVLFVLLASSFAPSFAEIPQGIRVEVTALTPDHQAADKVMVQVAYTNITDQAITMLKWGTALEGRINEDFFRVSYQGQQLSYRGRVYKRAAPQAQDYALILPDQTLTANVDLREAYAVDFSGDYTAAYRANLTKGDFGVEFSLIKDMLPVANKVTPSFQSCSAGQQGLIDSALSEAEKIARIARDDLAKTPVDQRASAQRYARWFGSYDVGRWNSVQDHFNRIYSAANSQTVGFDCNCNNNSFAFVSPNDPYNITLCNAFWSAPLRGTDSKSGTIVHEISHFTVVGGTDDHAYGQGDARNLAAGDPNRAVDNADSHEYFAENTPFYSMPEANTGSSGSVTPSEPEPEPEPEPAKPVIAPWLDLLLGD